MKKILILYTAVGIGHKIIAQNIAYWLQTEGYEVVLEDILAVERGGLVDGGTSVHQFINKRVPWLWDFLYRSVWFSRLTMPFRTLLASFHNQRTKALLAGHLPDLVITTQATASAVVASLKQKGLYSGLFAIAFSDFHFHPYWYYKEADYYLTNIVEQKAELMALGVPEERVFVCGMSLPEKKRYDKALILSKFGINSNERLLLMASGSLGTLFPFDFLKDLLDYIDRKDLPWHVVVVCGKNRDLVSHLDKRFHSDKLHVVGFYESMEELYGVADIFFTKPGGLSVAQALQYGLAVFITHFLPGQERLNLNYLAEKHLICGSVVGVGRLNLEVLNNIEGIVNKDCVGDRDEGLIQTVISGIPHKAVILAVKHMFHRVDE